MKKIDFEREKLKEALVVLLLELCGGMEKFKQPIPDSVAKGVVYAASGFNEEILPHLHSALTAWQGKIDLLYIVATLGKIAHPSSVPYLIDYHRNYANFISGLAAVQALQKISDDEGYHYFANVIRDYASGNPQVVNSAAELPVICTALGAWGSDEAFHPLREALNITNPNRMPLAAIEALAKYPEEHQYLLDFAEQNPALRSDIENVLSNLS